MERGADIDGACLCWLSSEIRRRPVRGRILLHRSQQPSCGDQSAHQHAGDEPRQMRSSRWIRRALSVLRRMSTRAWKTFQSPHQRMYPRASPGGRDGLDATWFSARSDHHGLNCGVHELWQSRPPPVLVRYGGSYLYTACLSSFISIQVQTPKWPSRKTQASGLLLKDTRWAAVRLGVASNDNRRHPMADPSASQSGASEAGATQSGPVPYGRKTQTTPALKEVHIVWITAGLGCDGDSV